MTCEAYIIAWQEAEIIGLTIKHYQHFCTNIIVFDNHSTDRTREIAAEMGAEVRLFGIPGVLDDKEYLKIKNNAWKGSKADWVIMVDCDEILWHPNINKVLSEEGYSIFATQGWDIVSHDVPRETLTSVSNGYAYSNYSKSAIFNPRMIREIGYVYGCHQAKPAGLIRYSPHLLMLFHYSNIGGPERLCHRHAAYRARLSENNKRWGLGIHYTLTDEQRTKEWHEKLAKSSEFSPDLYYSPEGQTLVPIVAQYA